MRLLAIALTAILIGSALGSAFNRLTAPDLGPCYDPGARCVRLVLENQP